MISTGTENTDSIERLANTENMENGSLMWVRGKLNNQFLDMMVDSGASISCIAFRCVSASPYLKDLIRHPYSGSGLVDVNGKPLPILFEITAPLVIGNPKLSIDVTFVVVDDLPHSCILGLNFMSKLNEWGIDNKNRNLRFNNSTCPIFYTPQTNTNICLISKTKLVILPGDTVTIATSAGGIGMNALRPNTDITILTEGDIHREKRTNILVIPALNLIHHKNSANVRVTVKNVSSQRTTIGKGSKIAIGSSEYSCFPSDTIHTIEEKDSIDFLCSDKKLGYLTQEQRYQVRTLLSKYRGIFSMSNAHIGKTTVNNFDICTDNLYPVADSLRRVPLHKEII